MHYRPEGAIHESFNPFFPCLPFRNVSSLRPAARRAPRTPTPNSTVTAPPPRRSTSNPATTVSGRPNCPTGFSSGGCAPSGEAEQRSLERELRSDEESPLHIPLEIFMTAYYERYERVKGMASFLSDDCAVGSEDAAAAVEAQLAGDADYRAQAFAFIEGFVCFQQSFSRHGIARASAALLIWLNENVL